MNDYQSVEMLLQRTMKVGDCRYWLGNLSHKGYGRVGCGGKKWFAHRLSYTLAKGEIPVNYMVMHSCDRPSCINPEHLSVGTAKDNAMDCASKGRFHRQGALSCSQGHKYTDKDWLRRANGAKDRYCPTCKKEYRAALYKRHKATAASV